MVQWQALRRSALVAGVTAAALVGAAQATAAGGSPIPVPDDPPAGAKVAAAPATPTASARSTPARSAPKTKATSPAAAAIPTPDPPVGVVGTGSAVEPKAAQTSAPARSTPASRAPVVTQTAVMTTRAVAQPPTTGRAAPVAPARQRTLPKKASKPAPAPKAKAAVASHHRTPHLPHDALRVALPVGALIVGRPDRGPDPGLLVLAALLLGVAAAGALVLGIAARSAASHA